MRFKTILFSLAGAAALAGGVALAYVAGQPDGPQSAAPPPAPLVEVARPEPVDRPPALVTTGFIRAADRLAITAEIAGRVAEVSGSFQLGARVPAGAILLRVERATYEAELMRARGALAGAEAGLRQATSALRRQEELAANNFASEATLEELSARRAGAEAELAAARATLRVAEQRLEDTSLTVPFDAIVTAEDVSPGQLLQPGQIVGEAVRADRAELRTSLPEAQYRRIAGQGGLSGKTVQIALPGGAVVAEAEITAIAPQIGDAARMVEIVARIAEPFADGSPLLLNGLVEVRIPLPRAQGDVFSLPVAALQVGQRIWKLDADNTLRPVDFSVERRTEDRVLIVSSGLAPDDRILLTALQTQIEGRQVRTEETGGT